MEKKYEPVPQVTPSLPPATLPKPAPEGKEGIVMLHYDRTVVSNSSSASDLAAERVRLHILHHNSVSSHLANHHGSSTVKPLAREDTVQTNFLPHKSFPEKSPVNGTSEQPPKTNAAPPAVSSYNRYTPKPYTTSAKPFARMFDSPKFNHNLLPNDKPEIAPKVSRRCPSSLRYKASDIKLDCLVLEAGPKLQPAEASRTPPASERRP